MHFPELSNFSVETSVQHLVFLTGSCLLALDKTQAGVFSISWFLVTFFTKRKTAINLEPVMISIWNLDYIILTREIQQPKNLNDDAMSAIHDFIIFFLVYDKFLAIHKLDFGYLVYNSWTFINNNIWFNNSRKHRWKILDTALTLLVWAKTLFLLKSVHFLQNNLASAKFRRVWHYKVYFLKLDMCVYLCNKFQGPRIILGRFGQYVTLIPPPQM